MVAMTRRVWSTILVTSSLRIVTTARALTESSSVQRKYAVSSTDFVCDYFRWELLGRDAPFIYVNVR